MWMRLISESPVGGVIYGEFIDEHGRFVVSRLTVRRNAKAAKAFIDQACRGCGLYPPMTILTDKAPTYPAIIKSMDRNAYTDLPIAHISDKGSNNRIDSDHTSLKRITDPGKGFQSRRTAKATLKAIEAFRSIKHRHLTVPLFNTSEEIGLVEMLMGVSR